VLGQLNDEEIETLLRSEVVGRLGCHANGRTYVVPLTYAYEEGAIIAHSAEGLKLRIMRENPNVCFEVDRIDDLGNWQSVIAWGRYEELSGTAADRAIAHFLTKLLPITIRSKTSHTPKDLTHQHRAQSEGLPAVTFCIRLIEKTGRFETLSAS